MNITVTDIKKIINTIIPHIQIVDDTELFKTGILDSLQIVELIVTLNQEFSIKLTPLDFNLRDWATPMLIYKTLQKKL